MPARSVGVLRRRAPAAMAGGGVEGDAIARAQRGRDRSWAERELSGNTSGSLPPRHLPGGSGYLAAAVFSGTCL